MNFYHEKHRAKKNSFLLIFIFLLSVGLFIFFINTIALGFYSIFHDGTFLQTFELYKTDFAPKISAYVSCVVLFGMGLKYFQLRSGGKAVAESLNAYLISKETRKYHEQLILNVVEEMSLASGISMPPVYLLQDSSINAFVAGYSYDDAVIVVTRGMIEKLSRDEIQGVIAHEFSHIFNGDMRLNLILTSILNGVLIVGIIGWQLIHFPLTASTGDKNFYMEKQHTKDEIGAGIAGAFLIFGVILMILGFVGTLIGSSIKALISRQREYLADAGAVQYTRYPDGIANALKKIGGDKKHSYINSISVELYSHFYFANGVEGFMGTLISSHPPLYKRIWRLDGNWDGEYIVPFVTSRQSFEKPKISAEEKIEKATKTLNLMTSLDIENRLNQQNIQKAQNLIFSLPPKLLNMSKNAFSAEGVILALLAKDELEIDRFQINSLKDTNEELYLQFSLAFKEVKPLQRASYLPLIQLCIPSLKQMSKNQYRSFRDLLTFWIWSNDKMVFFEWNLKQLLLYPLDIHFGYTNPSVFAHTSISEVRDDISYFVSFLIFFEYKNEEFRKELFDKVCSHVDMKNLRFINIAQIDFQKLQRSFENLMLLDDTSTTTLLKMAIFIFSENGQISSNNKEMIYAIASALRLPLPLGLW